MQQARLLGITALLSVMVWLVADHSLTEVANIRVRLEFLPTEDQNMRVALAEGEPNIVNVSVAAKRSIIQKYRTQEIISVRLPVSPRASKTYRIPLLEQLRSAQELRDVGVQEVVPPDVDIEVDRDTTVRMPISVQTSGALKHRIPPSVEPDEVSVIISERALAHLTEDQRVVTLNADEFLKTADVGKLGSINVPLRQVVEGISVQVDPDHVALRYEIEERLESTTIPAVPIKIEASADIFNGYTVEFKDAGPVLTQPLTVKGPRELIERIESGELRIHGVIALTAANKAAAGSFQYVTPVFKLPKGIERIAPPEAVEFRLVPRNSPINPSE